MQPLVSVIIPVYNVADYLGACLESVCQQTYTNLEIILIDDGSTDGSLDKVRDLIQADARVRVLTQTNQGAAAARNKGLDEAKGDYILFVDADDWVTPDAVASLYALTQEFQTKLAVGGVVYYNSEGGIDQTSTFSRGVWSSTDIIRMMYTEHRSLALGAGKFIHRDLLSTLRFPNGKLVEDAFFQPQLYHLVNRAALDSKLVYHYFYQRSGNASSALSLEMYQHHLEALASSALLFGNDSTLVDVIRTRQFTVKAHYLGKAADRGDWALLKQIARDYWKDFSYLSLKDKTRYLKAYFLYKWGIPIWHFLKRCKKKCWQQVLLPLDNRFKNSVWYQWPRGVMRGFLKETGNRRNRLPAFREGLAQVQRTGYFGNTIGRYAHLPQLGVCYLDNAKVASTSIKEALLVANGGSMANLFQNDIHIHFSQYFVRPIEPGVALPDFSFVFVRNPFERVVSTYKNMYHSKKVWSTFKVYLFGYFKKDRGFDYFVRKGPVRISDKWADTHLVSQHVLVYGPEGQCYADFIGRFEHLTEDWKEVQQRVALPDLPVRNQTAKSDWRDYYTLELAQLVYQRYQKDVEVFGYQDAYRDLVTYLEEKEKSSAGL